MQISPTAQQLIDTNRQTALTDSAIATAVAAKQLDAAKQQGQAAVALVQAAAGQSVPTRGIDIQA